jgi:hypothetical protein
LLPNAGLGIALLSNAQENITFIQAVRVRVLELVYGQPMAADALLAQRAAKARQTVQAQLAQLQPLDLAAVAPYAGTYSHPELGKVTLALRGSKLVLDIGTLASELRSAGKEMYVVWDPPLVGLFLKLGRDSTGRRTFQLISENPDQSGTWTFTRTD